MPEKTNWTHFPKTASGSLPQLLHHCTTEPAGFFSSTLCINDGQHETHLPCRERHHTQSLLLRNQTRAWILQPKVTSTPAAFKSINIVIEDYFRDLFYTSNQHIINRLVSNWRLLAQVYLCHYAPAQEDKEYAYYKAEQEGESLFLTPVWNLVMGTSDPWEVYEVTT